MTGVDRVEFAYLRHLLGGSEPCFGIVRTVPGVLLIDRNGMNMLLRLLVGEQPLGPADILSRITRSNSVHAQVVPFQPLTPSGFQSGVILSGRPWHMTRLAAEAVPLRDRGRIVTAIVLSPGARRHRMRFGQDGIWWQTGGQFGASLRTDPAFAPWRFATRVAREAERLSRWRATT